MRGRCKNVIVALPTVARVDQGKYGNTTPGHVRGKPPPDIQFGPFSACENIECEHSIDSDTI